MTNRIQLLSSQLANQIAAGEVVERPASVLKELLENSLDAKAKTIHVDILQGGLKLIRVRDDGVGIDKEDLALALCRHATSKITQLVDLSHLMSLGFRGEALASISSVAKLTLTSATAHTEHAWQIYVEGEESQPILLPAAHPPGTTVDVRDLFFNTPARRRFLRTEKTEFTHIEELFMRMALSHFETTFILYHNQKISYHLPAALDEKEQAKRVAKIGGAHFFDEAVKVDVSAVGLRLWGWIGSAHFARSQTDLQFFFVNQRIIRDRLISHAIRQAYQDLLYEGRHPSYILYLEIDAQEIDVNVHPTKHEVRFHQGRLIHDFISTHLKKVLSPAVSTQYIEEALPSNALASSVVTPPKAYARQLKQSTLLGQEWNLVYNDAAPDGAKMVQPALETNVAFCDAAAAPPQIIKPALVALKLIAQVHEVYLLVESPLNILIVHIMNAKRIILFEQLKQHLVQSIFTFQPILVPIHLPLDADEMKIFERYQSLFFNIGLKISLSGPTTLLIKEAISILKACDLKKMGKTLFNKLSTLKNKTDEEVQKNILMHLAHSIETHAEQLSPAEIQLLLAQLASIEEGMFTQHPYLKPAIKKIALHELALYF